ncbi:MAG: cyclic nucleotide-binding domain-containing protein [Desulfobulbaceae bacterium]|jgi:CRP/FNR family cyclic AMP-dependent transcriptional regulator|nr:cyclic nucleotide-binding domain-containing protein [Desulfobulbaceae bacterium]
MDSKKCNFCDPQAEDIKNAFSFLSTEEEVGVLCPYLALKEWEQDATVMQEGVVENYMGFLIQGKLSVKRRTEHWGKHIIIAILDKGTLVGEGAFIDAGPRSTTIVAMEKCRMLVLTAQKMNELILNDPMLAIKLMKHMLHIISLRLRKAGDRISELL